MGMISNSYINECDQTLSFYYSPHEYCIEIQNPGDETLTLYFLNLQEIDKFISKLTDMKKEIELNES